MFTRVYLNNGKCYLEVFPNKKYILAVHITVKNKALLIK